MKSKYYISVIMFMLAGFMSALTSDESNEMLNELINNSPFIPPTNSKSTLLSSVDSGQFVLKSVLKIKDGDYQFGLTNLQTKKSIWLFSDSKKNAKGLNLQYYNYDEENKILVFNDGGGLVQAKIEKPATSKDTNTQAKASSAIYDWLDDFDDFDE